MHSVQDDESDLGEIEAWRGVVNGVEPHFDVQSRETGHGLFAARKVRIGHCDPDQAKGVVDDHATSIDREVLARGVRFEFGCECPRGRAERPCAHNFALALALEEATHDLDRLRARRVAAEPSHLRDSRERLARLTGEAAPTGGETDLAGSQWRVLYRIAPGVEGDPAGLRLGVVAQRRRRDGEWGAERALDTRTRRELELDDPQDRRVLTLLEGAHDFDVEGQAVVGERRFVLTGDRLGLILPELAATGRLDWIGADPDSQGLTLDEGGSFRASLRFERAEADGPGRIEADIERGDESVSTESLRAVTRGGFWIDDDRIGRLDHERLVPWLAELVGKSALEIPREHEQVWMGALARVAPEAVEDVLELEAGRPEPELVVEGAWAASGGARKLPARIRFWYGDVAADPFDPTPLLADSAGEWSLRRDIEAERALLSDFRTAGGELPDEAGAVPTVASSILTELARTLLERGWAVESSGRAWRLHTDEDLRVRSGIDWFDLEGGLRFGAASVALPKLLAAAADEGNQLIELDDGSLGLLPEEWSESRAILGLAKSVEGDALRFGAGQALLVEALLAERSDVELDARYREVRERLSSANDPSPRNEPEGFQGELRTYQREGLGWLGFLSELGLGGCLADDMGLGKTVQLLALLEERQNAWKASPDMRRPTLVVAPSSLVFNWLDEAARFTPELRAVAYTGPDRARILEDLTEFDVLVTNYALLRRDVLELREIQWDLVVLDEAQAIKNASSQVAKASRLLDARQRFALSGTPIENHLGELWSLFEFLNPGMLGRSARFRDLVKASSASREGSELELISKAVKPFVLRRRKAEVLEELPPRTEQTVHVELGPEERQDYDELRNHYRASLLSSVDDEPGSVGRQSIHVLEALLRLRQAACHPGLVDKRRKTVGSAKLDTLLELLSEVVESGQKALIFSQFVQFLDIVRAALDQRELRYEYLDGRTKDRKAPVESFQNDADVPLMLVSLKAGGTGLNLTAADFVFLIDPWWNPAVEAQAIDRAHRIGRTKPVVAYRLITVGTVEERVLELQEGKRELAAAVLDGAGGSVADLSREDLERLLS